MTNIAHNNEYGTKYGISDLTMNKYQNRIKELKSMPSITLQDILLASPYDSAFALNGKMTEDLFYDFNLIEVPKRYYEIKKEIDTLISSSGFGKKNNRFIFFNGYAGCGKSTFLHWYIKENNEVQKNLFIDVSTVYAKKNKKGKRNIIRASVLKLVLDELVFNNNQEKDELQEIAKKINDNINILKVFDNKREIISHIGGKLISKKYQNSYDYSWIVNKLNFEQELCLLIILVLMKRKSFEEKIVFYFDNLDSLGLSYLTNSFVDSVTVVNKVMEDIINLPSLFGKRSNINYIKDIKFIFSIRESNYETINAHILERLGEGRFDFHGRLLLSGKVNQNMDMVNFSSFFCNWLIKRLDFANKILRKNEEIELKKFVKAFINDEETQSFISSVFNYNFREIIKFINYFYRKSLEYTLYIDVNYINEYTTICKNNVFQIGARGIIWNLAFRYLIEECHLYDMVGIKNVTDADAEYNKRELNRFRVLLIAIYNKSARYASKEYRYTIENSKKTENLVELGDLYNTIENFFDREINPFANHLKNLGKLHEEDRLFNPVSFKNVNITKISRKKLTKYFEKNQKKGKSKKYCVSLNPSGYAYLRNITPRFEWFNARYNFNLQGCSVPLYCTPLAETKNGNYVYEETIDNVKHNVSLCINAIKANYNNVYEVDKRIDKFLKGPLVIKVFDENTGKRYGRMHPFRIVDHHTTYLDSFRRYMLGVYIPNYCRINDLDTSKLRKEVNRYLVDSIKFYIDLIYFSYFRSDKNKKIFDYDINNIYEPIVDRIKVICDSDYSDYQTVIRY